MSRPRLSTRTAPTSSASGSRSSAWKRHIPFPRLFSISPASGIRVPGTFSLGNRHPARRRSMSPGFIVGHPVGAVVVSGSAASNPQDRSGRQQQRKQPADRAQSFQENRVLFKAASTHLWCLVPAFPVQRNTRAQPVRAGYLHQPANFLAGNHVHADLVARPCQPPARSCFTNIKSWNPSISRATGSGFVRSQASLDFSMTR